MEKKETFNAINEDLFLHIKNVMDQEIAPEEKIDCIQNLLNRAYHSKNQLTQQRMDDLIGGSDSMSL